MSRKKEGEKKTAPNETDGRRKKNFLILSLRARLVRSAAKWMRVAVARALAQVHELSTRERWKKMKRKNNRDYSYTYPAYSSHAIQSELSPSLRFVRSPFCPIHFYFYCWNARNRVYLVCGDVCCTLVCAICYRSALGVRCTLYVLGTASGWRAKLVRGYRHCSTCHCFCTRHRERARDSRASGAQGGARGQRIHMDNPTRFSLGDCSRFELRHSPASHCCYCSQSQQ